MLPRVATTTGTARPSPALPADVSDGAAVMPPRSAAALANLRAEVLLRLIETMLKHMPPAGEANPGRDLLEILLAALKSLPGRGEDGGRTLKDLLAKLPQALRPSVEKLIGTVLSAMPTRALIEVVRSPNGSEAQKLAALLSANLDTGSLAGAGTESRQKQPTGLTVQQLAAVDRHGPQQAGQPVRNAVDARALQTLLKRIFDIDDGGKMHPARTAETVVPRQALAVPGRLPAGENAAPRAENPLPALRAGNQAPVDAAEKAVRHSGNAEEPQTTMPTAKREDVPVRTPGASSAGQALARSILQAVARDLPPALLMQAAAHLMENLTPEEATFLRTLLERPFETAPRAEQGRLGAGQPTGDEGQPATTEMAANGKARPGSQPAAAPAPSPMAEPADPPLPLVQAREAMHQLPAGATPDRMVPAMGLRDGVPLAFVPYLPAEEDLDWPEPRQRDEEEAGEEEQTDDGSDNPDTAGDRAGDEGPGDEAEAPDMAKRREKTAAMVGTIEPGVTFYQKLGDYWT